ncbi:MAG: hypothetical protein IT318_23910 [Anaerolineales bacterium]|nr:hypothetical protein [Anaerolineales bacterium]
MAETVFAEYGQKRIPVPEGMTQAQVTEQMRRFFPELADPKIETKTEKDKKIWVYSKKAGTKGHGPRGGAGDAAAAVVFKRLLRVRETPIAPAWFIDVALGSPPGPGRDFERAGQRLLSQAQAAEELGRDLAAVRPDWTQAAAKLDVSPLL